MSLVCTSEKLSTEIVGRYSIYENFRFVYEAGREPKVKELVEKASTFGAFGGNRKQPDAVSVI